MYGGTDHYAVLGLAPSADDVVVHAAWKALLRKHHPDTNPGDASGIRAREINEAFAVLGKPEARAHYDRLRARPPDIAPIRQPLPVGPRFRPPPRGRLSPTRLFGATLLLLAAIPISLAALLAFPETAPTIHRTLVTYSAGSPLAEDLVDRLDALASRFAGDPPAAPDPGQSSADPTNAGLMTLMPVWSPARSHVARRGRPHGPARPLPRLRSRPRQAAA